MDSTVKDMREAWKAMQEFMENHDETHLFLKLDSKGSKKGYTVVKLPYGENIYLLYAFTWHDAVLVPKFDLKYAGFYSKQHKEFYCIDEPLTQFIKFDGAPVYSFDAEKQVIRAVQATVAEYIAKQADEFNELSFDDLNKEIACDAETAFSKKETVIDFASKIEFGKYGIGEIALVDFIDNPANISKPNSLLKSYVDNLINGNEEKLARLWFAHCNSQKLLDLLHKESESGTSDE